MAAEAANVFLFFKKELAMSSDSDELLGEAEDVGREEEARIGEETPVRAAPLPFGSVWGSVGEECRKSVEERKCSCIRTMSNGDEAGAH
ncbi:hypothetical protein EYF80_027796 [Liparis tanakae]|uniref:Uncharacterized protein n=1 Tax=Liparis tanakae TaxID=230148 RepID=A0A4Z2H8N0_9TELE|nr:hypothetical protein EYF80_027796 [Liparis tanakae]